MQLNATYSSTSDIQQWGVLNNFDSQTHQFDCHAFDRTVHMYIYVHVHGSHHPVQCNETRMRQGSLLASHMQYTGMYMNVIVKQCQYNMLLYMIIQHKNMVSIIQHIQLSNKDPDVVGLVTFDCN